MEAPYVFIGSSQEILKNYIKDSFAEMGLRLKKLEDMFPGPQRGLVRSSPGCSKKTMVWSSPL